MLYSVNTYSWLTLTKRGRQAYLQTSMYQTTHESYCDLCFIQEVVNTTSLDISSVSNIETMYLCVVSFPSFKKREENSFYNLPLLSKLTSKLLASLEPQTAVVKLLLWERFARKENRGVSSRNRGQTEKEDTFLLFFFVVS